jgi:glycosyltransferase involved in cell wall biosynthesis
MRVCLIGPSKKFLSGISYYTIALANALSKKHEVSVLFLRDLLPRRLFPGNARVGHYISDFRLAPEIPFLDGIDWYWGPNSWRGASFLARTRPEVIVMPWWTSSVAHSYILLRWINAVSPRASRIVEFHEVMDPLEQRMALLRVYARVARRLAFTGISAYIAHSRHELHQVQEAFQFLRRDVGFVASLGTFDQFRKKAPLREHPKKRILCLGLLRPYKGVEHLIRAFEMMPEEVVESVILTIVGETWENYRLPSQLIEASPRRNQIEFVNRYVTDSEVDDFFGASDVACLPYLRAMQSGAARIAMNYGIPIVASKVGGLAESLSEYKGAFFSPPGDPIGLRDALLTALGHSEERFADPFSWERTVKEYEAALASTAKM